MLFYTSKNDKVQSKTCQNCIPFVETIYIKMQRKRIPRVYEYQLSTSSHQLLTIDIKHQADRVLVDV